MGGSGCGQSVLLRFRGKLFRKRLLGRLLFLLRQCCQDLRLHLIKGTRVRLLLFLTLDDVVAELCLDQLRGLPRLQGKRSLLESRHRHTLFDKAQLAAACLRAWIVRILSCQVGKVAAFVDLVEDALRLRLCRSVVRRTADLDQNVADLHLVINLVIRLVCVVVGLLLSIRHLRRAAWQACGCKGQVLQLARLRDRIGIEHAVCFEEVL